MKQPDECTRRATHHASTAKPSLVSMLTDCAMGGAIGGLTLSLYGPKGAAAGAAAGCFVAVKQSVGTNHEVASIVTTERRIEEARMLYRQCIESQTIPPSVDDAIVDAGRARATRNR